MVIFSFFYEDKKLAEALMNETGDAFPQITSLMFAINPKANDTLDGIEVIPFRGNDHLIEKMEDLRFRISPKSFFQTNTSQAYNLYRVTRDFAGLSGEETVYDLYTGTGTIALFLARHCKKIIGVEYVQDAVDDGKMNADLNGITNAAFVAGDLRDVLNESFYSSHGRPDVIITDPPRNGMHEDVVKAILSGRPRRIIYVSCNPATQARDILLLSQAYRVVQSQPIDMFPFTHHVENVALLELQ
jgi:23S rRNA (uracil1939-C5)-methyltransferase